MKDDLVYVHHIRDAIAQIEKYVKHMTYKKFGRSRMVQDAVVRQVTIIGEAARNLSPEFRQNHPEIPWAKVIGMRNVLVHDYFGIDIGEVWRVTQDDLPALKKQVGRILRDARKNVS